jgi:hypothetical protein
MQYIRDHRSILQVVMLLLALNLTLAAQSQKQSDKDKQEQSKKSDKKKEDSSKSATPAQPASATPAQPATATAAKPAPAPLFEGKSTLKSSRQGKETATAGFNGVNPDGEIQKTVLAAAPTAQDQAHVNAMSATSVDPAELAAFTKEGNLSTPK